MTKPIKEPEDLELKIGSKEEAAWTLVRDKCREEILSCKRTIEMDKVLIELAEKKINQEKENFK